MLQSQTRVISSRSQEFEIFLKSIGADITRIDRVVRQ
jgi:hypothetical protein